MSGPRNFVFLAVNASYSHSSLAAWCLRGTVDPQAWAWHTVEATINDDVAAVEDRVAALDPAVVGATLYLFNRKVVAAILSGLRQRCPRAIIVVGGPECLGDNRRLLETIAADAAVRGEGERALPALLNVLDTPGQWATVPGVCAGTGDGYRDGRSAEVIDNLNELPSFYDAVLPGLAKPFVQLETARGCENGCLFCTSRDTRVRLRSVERVRADLETIRRHGVRYVRVVDRTFNAGAERALSLVRLFRDDFPELRFHLELDPARVSERFADELAAAGPGRFHVEAGVQSLSEAVQVRIGRESTPARTLAGLARLCARPEIAVHVDLIAGLPGGTLAALKNDVATLIRLRPAEIQLERLKLLPGTPLAERPEQWGLVGNPEPPYEVRETATMTADDLHKADGLRRFLDGFYNAAGLQAFVIAAVENDASFLDATLQELDVMRSSHTVSRASLEGAASSAPVTGTPAARALRLRSGQAHGPPFGEGGRAPLEERFRALHRVLVGQGNAAARGLELEWIRRGFSLRHGLCPAQPWKQPLPPGCVLIEGDEHRPQLRRWRVELERLHFVCYGTGADGARCVVAVYRG